MYRNLINLILAGLVVFVSLDLAARPAPPRITGVAPTSQGYLIKGTGFGTNKAVVRIQEGRRTLPAQVILSLSPTGIAVKSAPRPGVPVSILVRMGSFTSNPWRYTPPRSDTRKSAAAAGGYTLTVGVLKQVGGRNYGVSQADVTLNLGNKRLRSGKTDTRGNVNFANVAPSRPGTLYQVNASASGCQPGGRGYKMGKYNSKVNLILSCAAPPAATTTKKPTTPGSATARSRMKDPRLQTRQPTPSTEYMAMECLRTPTLYSASQNPPYNGVMYPDDGVTNEFHWTYDGCRTYFQICWNLATLNRGPDSPLCYWQDTGPGTSFRLNIGVAPYSAVVGEEVDVRVKACVTGAAETECGDWSNMLRVRVAEEPAGGGGGGMDLATACNTIRQVVVSPRCVNCHNGNAPRVGNNGGIHPGGITRDSTDCARCHNGGPAFNPPGTPNVDAADANVPWAGAGLPLWGMPGINRNWQGLNANTIIQRMASTTWNGGMSLPEVVTHVDEDHLIVWAWNPTNANGDTQGRTSAFGTHQGFVDAMDVWANNEGTCP